MPDLFHESQCVGFLAELFLCVCDVCDEAEISRRRRPGAEDHMSALI